jgi:S-adenosylmethionine synthetase
MARYIAKNLVAAELAQRCEVQLAYAIGVADPVSVLVDSFGTGVVPDDRLAKLVREIFELKPAGINRVLGLKRPIYRRTASYGHFGRVPDGPYFSWERTDRVDDLRSAAGLGRARA